MTISQPSGINPSFSVIVWEDGKGLRGLRQHHSIYTIPHPAFFTQICFIKNSAGSLLHSSEASFINHSPIAARLLLWIPSWWVSLSTYLSMFLIISLGQKSSKLNYCDRKLSKINKQIIFNKSLHIPLNPVTLKATKRSFHSNLPNK